eukprot:NODE_934_length_1753_cov_7.199877_g876_i0.p1 GENE.NODE_934_length_1753_cov_7.199877_g876_i0~~NODE_934_length_1753_cov_7.199877_g876_i0.p1  ORF type:complete len:561 (-),score=123.61 NODE_934_length_1753_cov_7.199877_g876_i0:71-1699(-)
MTDWLKLVQTGQIKKVPQAQLKQYLREHKLSQVGDAADQAARITRHLEGFNHLIDGVNPAEMKLPLLRKEVAKRGLSVIGNQDEMLTLLLEHLKRTAPATAPASAATAPTARPNSTTQQHSIAIAKEVLRLGEMGEHTAILSLLGETIATHTDIAQTRKAFLKLSLLLHPDKLGSSFEGATRAFQALVFAFETVTRPETVEAPLTNKTTTIARSNAGCYRTKVKCPRCKVEWGAPVEGNPDYFYNFLMMGLKSFTCSTCLLEFGCMAGLHLCPHCHCPFDYHPKRYHEKVTCGRPNCKEPFGFWLYHVSERALGALREEIKSTQAARLRTQEAKRRRAASAQKRGNVNEDPLAQERLFILGLRDHCPRCGESMSMEGYPDEEAQQLHLLQCTDPTKAAAHKKRVAVAADLVAARAHTADLQSEVASGAAWEFLGGQATQLWLLSESLLRDQCEVAGLSTSGTKEELIARIAHNRKGQKQLGPTLTLKAVCAAHGLPATGTRKDMLRRLEDAQFSAWETPPLAVGQSEHPAIDLHPSKRVRSA